MWFKKRLLSSQLLLSIHFCVFVCAHSLNCVRLCDPMDCGLPGSSVHGVFQAILERVVISYSKGVFPTWGWNLCLLRLPHWQEYSLPLCHLRSLYIYSSVKYIHIVVQYISKTCKSCKFETLPIKHLFPPLLVKPEVTAIQLSVSMTLTS